jgi:hypothetical protein
MSKGKRGLGDIEFAGKVKTQTFKQFQFERLIKEGKVIPASKLEEAKELELQRVREFDASSVDEERYRRAARVALKNKLDFIPLIRERFEE